MELKRVTDWLGTAEGLGKAILSFLALLSIIWAKFTEAAVKLGLSAWVLGALVTAVVILLFVTLQSYRRFSGASRLEKRDALLLRPSGPSDLFGRDADLADLLKAVKNHRLVLLDGESGCGKSALVMAGLAPTLRAQATGLLPVLVRDWGEDWHSGPVAAVLDALWQALSESERERLGWPTAPDLADTPERMLQELEQRLGLIFATLGRRPLLLLDQFDDHQARHRAQFLDDDGNWLRPGVLVQRSPFWALLARALREDRLHLLVVTRNDTAAGLACIDMLPERTARRSLPRLDNTCLPELLAQLTQNASISNPERGWEQLRQQLEGDLKAEGALLMQQVRTVLLGLRELPTLTLRDYRRAGGLRGLETLFISRALRRAAEKARDSDGLPLEQARALLQAMTLPGSASQAPKSRRQERTHLDTLARSPAQAERLLQALVEQDLVRPADTSSQGRSAWQLDHDYLAKAVLAEKRQANRWHTTLMEGYALYRQATGSFAQQWATLLPIFTQARLWWEHGRGRLPWNEAQAYVRHSLLKPLVLLLTAGVLGSGGIWGYMDWQLGKQADELISQFGTRDSKQAVLDIWHAPEELRNRVRNRILVSPANLEKAVKAGWPLADVALDSQRAKVLAQVLRARWEQEENSYSSKLASLFAESYASVAARLSEPADILAEAQALRAGLEQEKDSDSGLAISFAESYARVAARLSEPADVLAAAQALRTRLEQEQDGDLARKLADSYDRVADRLSDPAVILAEVQALRAHLEQEKDSYLAISIAQSYASVSERLSDPAAVREAAQTLRARMEQEKHSGLASSLTYSYARVAARLSDPAAVLAAAQALRARMEQEKDSDLASSFARSYAIVAARLSDPAAVLAAAQALRARLEQEKDSLFARNFAESYSSVAERLSDPSAVLAEAKALRVRLEQEKNSLFARNFAESYSSVAERLSDPAAVLAEAKALRVRLEQEKDSNSPAASNFAESYARVAARLSDPAAVLAEAQALRTRLEQEQDIHLARNFAESYFSVAARLNDPAAILAEAQALRPRLEGSSGFSLDINFAQSYASVAARLSDPAAVRDAAQALRARWERQKGSRLESNFAYLYASVAARLSDPAAVRDAAQALLARLEWEQEQEQEQEEDGITVSNYASSYARVAARIAEQPSIQPAAALAREALTLAGYPFLNGEGRASLIPVLKTLAKREFPEGLPEAVIWAEKEYGLKAADLRPAVLPAH